MSGGQDIMHFQRSLMELLFVRMPRGFVWIDDIFTVHI
jgi:hypothetical protein